MVQISPPSIPPNHKPTKQNRTKLKLGTVNKDSKHIKGYYKRSTSITVNEMAERNGRELKGNLFKRSLFGIKIMDLQ